MGCGGTGTIVKAIKPCVNQSETYQESCPGCEYCKCPTCGKGSKNKGWYYLGVKCVDRICPTCKGTGRKP